MAAFALRDGDRSVASEMNVTPLVDAMSLAELAQRPQQAAVEIHVEASTRYALVTDVLATAHDAGVREIGIAPVRD